MNLNMHVLCPINPENVRGTRITAASSKRLCCKISSTILVGEQVNKTISQKCKNNNEK